jgi:hypothetical protein
VSDDVFSYREDRDGIVSIRYHGRPVAALRGKAAARFLTRMDATDAAGAQLEMAKATGNFKHGNERVAKGREHGRG